MNVYTKRTNPHDVHVTSAPFRWYLPCLCTPLLHTLRPSSDLCNRRQLQIIASLKKLMRGTLSKHRCRALVFFQRTGKDRRRAMALKFSAKLRGDKPIAKIAAQKEMP